MLTIKVRIVLALGVGGGGSSFLRGTWSGMAGKFLSPFMAVGFKVLQLYLCSVLFSMLS